GRRPAQTVGAVPEPRAGRPAAATPRSDHPRPVPSPREPDAAQDPRTTVLPTVALSTPALSTPALSTPALSTPALSMPALSMPALSMPALPTAVPAALFSPTVPLRPAPARPPGRALVDPADPARRTVPPRLPAPAGSLRGALESLTRPIAVVRGRRRQPMLVALLPAHDEQDTLPGAIAGLRGQTTPPDRIVVISDNSTDATPSIGRDLGVEVVETVDNSDKKAGALNQVLARLLPTLEEDDVVLVQDADSLLDPHFLEAALFYLRRGYGGVGGVFRGGPGGGFVGHLQRNEYARYARDVNRLNGKCLVITGTAALFKVGMLRQVVEARLDGRLPAGDGRGGVYDTTVLTEDNELTFALLHLGHRIISPVQCTLTTEVMESWRDLWKQRLRWKRGAVENCLQYGMTRVTWRYWGRQLFTMLGCLVSTAYLGTLLWAAVSGSLHIHPFWLAVSVVFIVERVVTVRYRGWRQMLLAATMYELVLDYFLQACHVKAYWDSLTRKTKRWN
ncbi:glycosyltransferase, partial [Pseudonocardia sp.]|uniref:glycosyltransferase n=1 Tax=Pseudonocardia sp. TaxID=60912 RepID=UPI003D14B5C1